ncbi:hypothetical protein B4U80_04346 [Leptotrombidium deliense]|uniref:Uncharacterized protein n=1 Tax=Leptotrombidium deliense TaxID=299467 RepID=A0A443SE56_9ACAR|nr:hypothetical protein B4U80_04346 [Leptotrombidium deliense]
MNVDPGFPFASQVPQPMNVYRTGTLRSSRSVPGFMMSAVNTWDGEPCPVHGSGPHSPVHGITMSPLPVPPPVTMKRFSSVADVRSISGGNNNFFPLMTIIPPIPGDGKHIGNQLVPTAQRPFFVPAFSEQMPVRENFKVSSPIPSIHAPVIASKMKHVESYPNEDVCCKGHLIVLWIILGVVTIGVISGIILGVTVN